MNESLPLVVLADVEHRQVPQGSEVQRFVEAAFAGGAITKETGDDTGAPLHRLGKGNAGSEGEFAPDDRCRQHDTEFLD